jgi:hypothetical protein
MIYLWIKDTISKISMLINNDKILRTLDGFKIAKSILKIRKIPRISYL